MRQQINLYQGGLVDKKVPLHAGVMFGVFVGCALLLLVASVFLAWQQGRLNKEINRLNQEQVELVANLQVLKLQNPPRQKDPLLPQVLKRKQQEFSGRKPLFAYLDNFNSGMATGFSPVIRGFAQYPLKGVWLTGIRLNNAERKVLLVGSALKAELVPAYVQHLGDKKVLKDQSFASLKVTRSSEKTHQVDFRLESDFGVADE